MSVFTHCLALHQDNFPVFYVEPAHVMCNLSARSNTSFLQLELGYIVVDSFYSIPENMH